MSEKTIRVKKEENRLLVYYSPSINFDEIVRELLFLSVPVQDLNQRIQQISERRVVK